MGKTGVTANSKVVEFCSEQCAHFAMEVAAHVHQGALDVIQRRIDHHTAEEKAGASIGAFIKEMDHRRNREVLQALKKELELTAPR